MAKLKTYKNISRPYDSYLNRDGSSSSSSPATSGSREGNSNFSGGVGGASGVSDINGDVEETAVKSSGGISDVWIKTFIRSTNWKPKTVGFNIDGRTGYAEFTNVFVSGEINAESGIIGGNLIGEDFISSTEFLSGPLGYGWKVQKSGKAEFQDVSVRGVLHSSVFEKDTISAVGGSLLISSADVLDGDMTALDDSTVTITGESSFEANEVVRLKDGVDDEWMLVTDAASAPTYTVTRDLAGSYAAGSTPEWKSGTAIVSMGVGTGDKTGFVLIDSSSAESPFIDVYGRNSNTYSDYTLHGRLGWLKGVTDSDLGLSNTDVWGLYTDNAYIKGKIVADTGKIGGTGGWTIATGSISSVNAGNTTTMASGGTNAFSAGTTGSPQFKVTHAGVMTATSGTFSGSLSAVTGTLGALTIAAGGNIKRGKTAYSDTTNAGFWLGDDSGTIKFHMGESATNLMRYDGTDLEMLGGTIAGADIKATSATSGANIHLDPANKRIAFLYDNVEKAFITANSDGALVIDGDKSILLQATGTDDAVKIYSGTGGFYSASNGNVTVNTSEDMYLQCDNLYNQYNHGNDGSDVYWVSYASTRMKLGSGGDLTVYSGDIQTGGTFKASGGQSGLSQTIREYMSDLEWDGDLYAKWTALTFTDGLLTGYGSESGWERVY